VLYELLTGHSPYAADTAVGVLHAHVEAPLPSVEGLPEKVGEVARWALAKDREQRPATAAEFAEALEEAAERDLGPGWLAAAGLGGIVAGILGGRVMKEAGPSSGESPSPARSSGTRVRVAVLAALLAVVVAVIAAIAFGSDDEPEPAASVDAPTTLQAVASTTTVASEETTTTEAPATTVAAVLPVGDPCAVGTWRLAGPITVTFIHTNGEEVAATGGANAVLEIAPDGTYTVDWADSEPFLGTMANGAALEFTYRGVETGMLFHHDGVVEDSGNEVSQKSLSGTIGGAPIEEPFVSASPKSVAPYSCAATGYTNSGVTWVPA
jgi:hypothetical protein